MNSNQKDEMIGGEIFIGGDKGSNENYPCREKTGRLCSEESRPDGEKTNNSRQRKTQKDYKRGYKKGSQN